MVAFPAGVYISMRRNIHRDWRQHIPKGRLPKAPVMGMLSIWFFPRKIKPLSWQVWEQRSWFLDMKFRYGFEIAYRDTWYWKKLSLRVSGSFDLKSSAGELNVPETGGIKALDRLYHDPRGLSCTSPGGIAKSSRFISPDRVIRMNACSQSGSFNSTSRG